LHREIEVSYFFSCCPSSLWINNCDNLVEFLSHRQSNDLRLCIFVSELLQRPF
jgi:hypothetical protein